MAYIGSSPTEKGVGIFSQDTFTGDGSTTTFDLTNAAPDGGDNEIQVFVDNVRQQSGSSNAYTLGQDGSGDNKRITFTAAPAASASIYVLNPGLKSAVQITTISDNTVTTAKIQDTNVSRAKLAADVIDATKLADAAVSEEHIDPTAITGHTELSAVAAADDVLLVFDTSASALRKIQVSNINSAPTITSISPTNALSGDGTGNHTFTITGTNFNSGVTAFFLNNSGTEVAFDSVTRNSSTQITGVIAKSSISSGEPFDIVVLNSNGQQAKLRNQVNVDASPTFVTAAGSLGSARVNMSGVEVNATDPDSAGNVTFELQSGSLPPGITLTNTGANGGTATFTGNFSSLASSDVTYNFVLRAVDAASNTSSRSFSFTTSGPTSQSFTSSGTFSVPSGVTSADVLVVGGGGSGGVSAHGGNGGGGAGGLVFMPGVTLNPGGTVTVTVGNGGGAVNAQSNGNTGQDSVFGASPSPGAPQGALTGKGGGFGGAVSGVPPAGHQGGPGGSGGGAGETPAPNAGAASQPTQPGNSGAYGFGNPGGTYGGQGYYASGGGGAGAAGQNGGGPGGAQGVGGGGVGKAYTIADGTTSVFYAGGGGSSGSPGGTANTAAAAQGGGGRGTGGASNEPGGPANDGVANRGGGGGGSASTAPCGTVSGDGGKGIVIVRF